jgi:hypothetical protein
MNLSLLRSIIVAILMVTPAFFAGCNQRASSKTAEESFEFIVDTFRRHVEGQNVGFVITEGSSRTSMTGTNKVTAQLVRPATPDDHYKGVVTVESRSNYSLRRTRTAEEIEREQNAKKQQGSTSLIDQSDKKGLEIIDPKLAGTNGSEPSPTSPKSNLQGEETVTRLPDNEKRDYQLVYDGDRWQLVTKLDPKTEQSIKFAFDEALARQ